ncbi:transposase domain-containing protein [Trebonia kvetii]|uniref:transposase domain-containing protein n=1 Tax=Trebonia kvetii TaxID=2480626 RepID=UPI001C9E50CA|nr:transposase domain-containing protein [Trebonia kvetii]
MPFELRTGTLGELTQQVPFEMVDAVLEQTCRVERRVRDLPARVVVYLLLAGCLFAELGYGQVWHRLTAGLDGLDAAAPTASAMTQARRRLGPGPLRELLALLRGPAPGGARWRGLLAVAIDGTIMTVADSEANLAVYSKQRGGPNGASGYPMLRLLVLVSCGTRNVIGAVFGPVSAGETTYAPGLLASLHAGMVLLADRGFGAGFLAAQIAGTRADFLIRVRSGRGAPGFPVLRRLPDGSWLSRFGGVPVRVIDAEITVTTSAGHAASCCRLVTTLLDPARYPAGEAAVLTMSAGRSRPPTSSSSPPSWAAGSCAPARPAESTRRSTPCWSPTRCCAPRSPTPPAPLPAPTPTGPASPSP